MKNILLLSALVMFPLSAVYAQPSSGSVSVTDSGEPNKKLPTSSMDVFPKLPPSSLCTKEKLVGIWKLIMIYEVPSGKEIELYSTSPLQYQVFEPDTRYGEYVNALSAISLVEVRGKVINKQKNVEQFSVSDSGVLFIYRDGIAVDSFACFLVAEVSPPFLTGQLLLMPPEKAARGRMVKVYQKMLLGFEAAPPPEPENSDEVILRGTGERVE